MNDKEKTVGEVDPENETAPEVEEHALEAADAAPDAAVLAALENPSEAVKSRIDELVQEGIKKALAGAPPKKAAVPIAVMSREKFEALDYRARLALHNNNRPLYNRLAKGE